MHSMDVMDMQKWAFLKDPPADISPMRELLVRYSRVPSRDVEYHLLRIVSNTGWYSQRSFTNRLDVSAR